MTKADAWKLFHATFLSELEKKSRDLKSAFTNPNTGSKAEAVILAMRLGFKHAWSESGSAETTPPTPSDAWDGDFNEPSL